MRQVPIQLCRSLRTCSQAPNPCPSTLTATSTPFPSTIPQLEAGHLSCSQDVTHVSQVHGFLNGQGILKVNLKFADNQCHYLRQLIQSLHQHHDHGLPINHSASRGWFWDVRPLQSTNTTAAATGNETFHRARSETMKTFPWHTDCSYETSPPRFFALHVLHPDQCGGGTLSVLQVDRLLSRLSSSSQLALSAPEYRIHVPPEFIKNDEQLSITGPILSKRTRPELRFREDIFTPLTARAKTAVENLNSLLLGPHIQTEVVHLDSELLPQHSIILLDNRRWLHARSDVKDPNRHLRRVRWDARPFI